MNDYEDEEDEERERKYHEAIEKATKEAYETGNAIFGKWDPEKREWVMEARPKIPDGMDQDYVKLLDSLIKQTTVEFTRGWNKLSVWDEHWWWYMIGATVGTFLTSITDGLDWQMLIARMLGWAFVITVMWAIWDWRTNRRNRKGGEDGGTGTPGTRGV